MLKKIIPLILVVVFGLGGKIGAQSLKKIHLMSSAPGQSNEAYVIAQRLGFYRQEGFDVEIVVARSSTAVQAVLGGSAEYVNHASVVPAILRGVPLRILLVDADKPPFYFVVSSKIASFKDVVGKTVAIDDFAGNAGMIARELLAKNGVAVDEVKFRVLGPPPFRLQALLGGAVDATLINFVMSGKARAQGFHVLAYSGDFISTVQPALATTQTNIKKSPGEVYRMVKATLKGYLFMYQNLEEGLKFFAETEGFPDVNSARDAWESRLLRSSEIARVGLASEETMLRNIERVKESLRLGGANLEAKGAVRLDQVYDFSLAKRAFEELRTEGWNPKKYHYVPKTWTK